MPAIKNQIFRIKIIDDLLSRHRWVKTSSMKKAIESKLLDTISERTIQNDLRDMRENSLLGYYAPIIHNKSKDAHSYEDRGYTINNFSLQPQEIDALKFYAECLQVFSGYQVFDAFTSGIDKVIKGVQVRSVLKPSSNAKLIIQTDSLATVQGGEYMGDMVYAIDNRLQCELHYLKYDQEQKYVRTVLPLLLREYRNRWYLLCSRIDTRQIRTYALDRIKKFVTTDIVCDEVPDFDPAKYFNHSFGITTPAAPVETIVLQFEPAQAPYIISLPVHKTQKILINNEEGITISISVILSYEVYEYIFSQSPHVKVISPQHLAERVSNILRKAAARYKISKNK